MDGSAEFQVTHSGTSPGEWNDCRPFVEARSAIPENHASLTGLPSGASAALCCLAGSHRSRSTGTEEERKHGRGQDGVGPFVMGRSEEHTSELQSLMRNSYAVF